MGWTKIGQVLHNCPRPSTRQIKKCGFPLRSEWTCNGCGQKWVYDYSYVDGKKCLQRVDGLVYIDSTFVPGPKCGEKL